MSDEHVAELSEGAARICADTWWVPGATPVDGQPADGAVRWLDVEIDVSTENSDVRAAVSQQLGALLTDRLGHAMPREVIDDLLELHHLRRGQVHPGGMSTLSAFYVDLGWGRDDDGLGVGRAPTLRPVELLVGESLLISVWHPPERWHPTAGEQADVSRARPEPSTLVKAWLGHESRTSGDLGVLLVSELAATYKQACYAIQRWLEDWELELYHVSHDRSVSLEEMRRRLASIWAAMTKLRSWVQPLNRPGLDHDPDQAWFPGVTLHSVVKEIDDLALDTTLRKLDVIAHTLRASFGVLHVELLQEERDRREHVQRRFELVAVAFLAPSLVVGLYGVNTHFPGEQTWWGFWVLLVVLAASAIVSTSLVRRAQARTAAARAAGSTGAETTHGSG